MEQPDGDEAPDDSLEQLLRALESGLGGDRPADRSGAVVAEEFTDRFHDQDLYRELAASGFAGPRFEVFCGELIAYGRPVLLHWITTGEIYRLCKARRRTVEWTDRDLDILRENPDERATLANHTLAHGLVFFRERALLGGQWSAHGGASLKTFFVGALLLSFKKVFGLWAAQHRKERLDTALGLDPEADEWRVGVSDPDAFDDAVASTDFVTAYIRTIPDPTDRTIVGLVVQGLTYPEIAEHVQLSNAAVTTRIYRLRQAQRRKA